MTTYQNKKGEEVTKDRFLQMRNDDILIFGNSYIEHKDGTFRLLDPSEITRVGK